LFLSGSICFWNADIRYEAIGGKGGGQAEVWWRHMTFEVWEGNRLKHGFLKLFDSMLLSVFG
jgi:hypothetical protein